MYDNTTQKIKLGDKVLFAVANQVYEGTVHAESIMQPGSWIVKRYDNIMVGPIYPRELLKS